MVVGRWEDFVSSVRSQILILIILVLTVTGSMKLFIDFTGLSMAYMYVAILTLIVVVLFASYQIKISKEIRDLLRERSAPSRSGPSEEKVETSGVGALVGMVLGYVIGLFFCEPEWVSAIIGGILCALLGNQIEYESIRKKRKRC